MKQIDLAWARELLKAALETQGRDFVYHDRVNSMDSRCHYRPQDNASYWGVNKTITGCLIGTAFTIAGPTYLALLVEDESIRAICGRRPELVTRQAARYFQVAQGSQDSGSTWGEAFDNAEAYAEENSAGLED